MASFFMQECAALQIDPDADKEMHRKKNHHASVKTGFYSCSGYQPLF